MKAANELTHIDNIEDKVFLKTKAFPVNMRLFRSSAAYRTLINHCCDLIKYKCSGHYEDYKRPHGMSGANCGIPFNIIGILRNRNSENEWVQIMINPSVSPHTNSPDTDFKPDRVVVKKSNCGSIRLEKPIKVNRYKDITVCYFDENGERHQVWYDVDTYGGTIQHEVDHNNGILITDREVKN